MEMTDWAASLPGTFPIGIAMQAASRTLFEIRCGDLKAATEWGERLARYLGGVLPLHNRHIYGRLLIAQGKKKEAMAFLRDLYGQMARAEANGYLIILLVYQALAAETPSQALALLTEALTLGESRGFIRSFVDEGELLEPLLRKALAEGITTNYTRKLLGIIEAERSRLQAHVGSGPSARASGVLSDRELEILKLVETGMSNRQIAERLIISLGTAKTHVHNIFEKLDAKTRTQAISRARDIRLI